MKPQSSQQKSHSKIRFTCFNSVSKIVPTVELKFVAPVGPPLPKSAIPIKKSNAPAQRLPLTPLMKVLNELWKKVSQKDVNRIFAQPVTEDIAPKYFDVIKEPMDLSTVKSKILHGEYNDLASFRYDVNLIFTNCMKYNPETTFFHQEAGKISHFFNQQYKNAKKQLSGDGPQAFSSSLRTFSNNITEQRRSITSIDIPVVIDTRRNDQKPFDFDQYKVSAHIKSDIDVQMVHVKNPPNNYDEQANIAKFQSLIEQVKRSSLVRKGLILLREKFPHPIMCDAIRKMSGIDLSFSIPLDILNEALESTDDVGLTHVAVTEANCDSFSINQLLSRIGIKMDHSVKTLSQNSNNVIDTMKLLLFYQNTLKHWCDPCFSGAKRKIMREAQSGIAKLALQCPLRKIITSQELALFRFIVDSASK